MLLRRILLVVLRQARLNFVHHAKIAHKLRPARVNQMRLPVKIAIDSRRSQIRQLRFAPREARRRNYDHQRGRHGGESITHTRVGQRTEPRQRRAPAGHRFTRPQSAIQNGVNQPRRRFQFVHAMQIVQQMRNAGHQRCALRASGNVRVKRNPLFRLQQPFEIIGQPLFG